jgi:hypothetical protein
MKRMSYTAVCVVNQGSKIAVSVNLNLKKSESPSWSEGQVNVYVEGAPLETKPSAGKERTGARGALSIMKETVSGSLSQFRQML